MGKDEKRQERLEILLDELDHARSLIEYHQNARMRLMTLGALLMLVLLLLAYTLWRPVESVVAVCPMAALVLPFVAIYLLVQYGYHTHFVVRGRAYASGLEEVINAELGESVLINESLESRLAGPLGQPHFLGINANNLTGMVSVMTLHYLVICGIMFIAGILRSRFILSEESLKPVGKLADAYFPLLFLWAVINVVYLLWNFLTNNEEKRLIAAVHQEYQPKE